VEPGGAIELQAAFCEESRTSSPSVTAARKKSEKTKDLFVVFSQEKSLHGGFYQAHNCETALAGWFF
jgi:hypothetical protein